MSRANSSWLARRIEEVVKTTLSGAYKTIKVDPGKYLQHLRRAYGLPIESFREMHALPMPVVEQIADKTIDRKSTRLNSSHGYISYAVFCLKKKKKTKITKTNDTHNTATRIANHQPSTR